MSDRVTEVIQCDGCGTQRLDRDRAGLLSRDSSLRQLLVEVGWRCDSASDVDLCPQCVALDEAGRAGGDR